MFLPRESPSRIEEVAQRAAAKGAEILSRYYESGLEADFKGEVNLVTKADLESQEAVIREIQETFPKHAILAEEDEESHDQSLEGPVWVIDPLDGTTNFSHGFGIFGVSIAYRECGETQFGLIHYPLRNEVFVAHRGKGSTLNGKSIHVSSIPEIDRSLLATGFPYNRRETDLNNVNIFSYFELYAQCVRRGGAAAIDLAHVAAGRFEGFWEPGLKAWDIAAGSILVEEAGGKVTDYCGNRLEDLHAEEIVATNGRVHEELLEGISLAGKTIINQKLFLSNA